MAMADKNEPYFFEKYFPSSYHLTFNAPIKRYPGAFNYSRDELERRSSISKDNFQVYVDVKDFKLEEISVKTVDQTIHVEGKQEKRPGNAVPHHFVREFKLPEFFDSEDVICTISEDRILEIRAKPASKKKYRHLEELKSLERK